MGKPTFEVEGSVFFVQFDIQILWQSVICTYMNCVILWVNYHSSIRGQKEVSIEEFATLDEEN